MTTTSPIYILGAGAVGMALAVHLTNAGRRAIAVRTSADDVAAQTVELTIAGSEGRTFRAAVETVSLARLDRLDGLIVVTAKSYANAGIAARLARMEAAGPVVILQNGVGVENPYLSVDGLRVYRCVLYLTGQKTGPATARFVPVRPSVVGVARGTEAELTEILAALRTDEFPFERHPNIRQEVWQKTAINSVFNTICPLLNVDNGIFIRDERAAAPARAIIAECAGVMRAQGLAADEGAIMDQLCAISRRSDGQLISTLQDINAGRETEIDALNLEVGRVAAGLVPPVSVPLTKWLGELVKMKAELARRA